MKLTVVIGVLVGTLVLACSTAAPSPVEPTPNIDATVEAKLAKKGLPTCRWAAWASRKTLRWECSHCGVDLEEHLRLWAKQVVNELQLEA